MVVVRRPNAHRMAPTTTPTTAAINAQKSRPLAKPSNTWVPGRPEELGVSGGTPPVAAALKSRYGMRHLLVSDEIRGGLRRQPIPLVFHIFSYFTSIFSVLVVTPISPAAARYYFEGQGPGRWVGGGCDALGLAGGVDQRALRAVLRGCHPGDGRYLPAHKPARRRAGWDLTLAAPKSVSLLAAMAGEASGLVEGAHRAAVDGVADDFERRLLRLRRSGQPGGLVAAEGMVAAAFEHRVNASGEPHLHSHLLLVNLGRDLAGAWSPINPGWWTVRRGMGAVYQMGLRHHLGAAGLDLDWHIREDGLADLADVPRAAVRSASSRGRAAAAEQASWSGADGGRRSGIRAAAAVSTRRLASLQPWEARALAAGFGPEEAARVIRGARSEGAVGRRGVDQPDRVRLVTGRLAAQRSSFRRSDVLVALAACAPEGLPAGAAAEWAGRFCATALPVEVAPGSAPRWTTPAARAADQALIDRVLAAERRMRPGRGPGRVVTPGLVEDALADHPELSPAGRAAARQLLAGTGEIRFLHAPPGRTNLLAQAAVLETAAAAWRATGVPVGIDTSDDRSAARWQALTGIEARRPGQEGGVIIVDHADRRPTPDLLAVMSEIDRAGGHAILVEGGTSPRLGWVCSDAAAWLGAHLGRLDPGPAPGWAGELPRGDDLALESRGRGLDGYRTAAEAAGRLVAGWADAWSGDPPAVLVGLGYAETDGLNQAARSVLARQGQITGPALTCRGRVLQAGDRVLALRRLAPDLPVGTTLEVADVDPGRARVVVRWGQQTATLARSEAAHLGYAYAVTPAMAARTAGRLMVLGPPDALGQHRARVVAAAMVVPDRRAGRGLDRGAGIELR